VANYAEGLQGRLQGSAAQKAEGGVSVISRWPCRLFSG